VIGEVPVDTIVVGLGNPLLGDDGVGWRVVEAALPAPEESSSTTWPGVEVDHVSVGGLGLMERLVGYERAILVDAIVSGRPVGTVRCLDLGELGDPAAGHLGSSHDTSLPTALAMGRALGAELPTRITVVAVEAGPSFEFGEVLSPPVAAAIPRAAALVRELLCTS